MQRWILHNILEARAPHSSSFAYRRGMSIVDCASAHIGARWLVKLDIDAHRSARLHRQRAGGRDRHGIDGSIGRPDEDGERAGEASVSSDRRSRRTGREGNCGHFGAHKQGNRKPRIDHGVISKLISFLPGFTEALSGVVPCMRYFVGMSGAGFSTGAGGVLPDHLHVVLGERIGGEKRAGKPDNLHPKL